MATATTLLRSCNDASVHLDNISGICADPKQPAGQMQCKGSATSEQPCSRNSGALHGTRKETTSAPGQDPAAIADAEETTATYSARSRRAAGSDSLQQQGSVVLAYRVTTFDQLTGAAVARPLVLSGSGALALQSLLMKLNAQRLPEQLQQQKHLTVQQSEAMQLQQQQQQPPVQQGAASGTNHSADLLSALATAGQAAAAADLQETLSHLQGNVGMAKDVLARAPQQLLQQGATAVFEQLQQYLQLQQRECEQQGLGTAAAAQSTLEPLVDRMDTHAYSNVCVDPLQHQIGWQRSGATAGSSAAKQGRLQGPGQHSWPSAGGAAAAVAAAPVTTRR
jgi:hypothetical protein